MHPLAALSRNRVRLLRNTLRQGLRGWLKVIGGPLSLVAFAGLVFYGALHLFRFLGNAVQGAPAGVLPQLQLVVLSSVSLGMFLFLIMTGMRSAYEKLFETGDTAFLLTQPIPVQTAFLYKAFDVYATGLATAAPLGLPVWWAFGVTAGAPAVFYLTSLLAVFLGILIFQSLSTLFLMLIMRFAPGKTLKQFLMAVTGISAVGIVVASQLLSSTVVRENVQDPLVLFETVSQWGLDRLSFLPHVWVTRAALFPLPQFDFSGTQSLGLLLVAALAFSLLLLQLAGRVYLAGWGAGQEVGVRSSARRKSRRFRSRLLRGTVIGLVRKDFIGFKREPLFWYNIAVSTIVLGFFAFNVYGSSGGSEASLGIGRGMLILMPALMSSILSSQLGGMGISREGAAWWYLQTSPINPTVLYWSKMLAAFLPSWLFSMAFVLLFHFVPGLETYPLGFALAVETALVAGIVSFILLLDCVMPDFNLKLELGKRSQGNSGKVVATMFGSMLFTVLVALTLTFPGYSRGIPFFSNWDGLLIQNWAVALTFAEAIGMVFLGYAWGRKRIVRLLIQG